MSPVPRKCERHPLHSEPCPVCVALVRAVPSHVPSPSPEDAWAAFTRTWLYSPLDAEKAFRAGWAAALRATSVPATSAGPEDEGWLNRALEESVKRVEQMPQWKKELDASKDASLTRSTSINTARKPKDPK